MKNKKSIFICVEDPLLQFTLGMIFQREGYQIVSQSQSQMTDFMVINDPVDLLILDKSDNWDEPWNQTLNKIRCQFAKQPIMILSVQLPGPANFNCDDFGLLKIIQMPADPVMILNDARILLT